MKNQSLTISGLAIVVLSQVFTPDEASSLVDAAVAIINAAGIIMVYYGRYRQGDIDLLGRKK